MNESITLDFPNIHFASKFEIGSLNDIEQRTTPLKIEEIPFMTVVTWRDSFYGIQHNPVNNGQPEKGGTFYIIKYDKILTFSQFASFIKEHSKEEFLIIDDYSSNSTDVRVFVEVQPNIIKLYFFSLYGGNGHFVPIASLQNFEGTSTWKEIQDLSNGKIVITPSHRIDEGYYFNFPIQPTTARSSSVNTFLVFNGPHHQGKVSIGNIMANYLYLPGLTRVKCELVYNRSIEYRQTIGDEANQSLAKRYGIEEPSNDQYWYNTQTRVHVNDCFPQADLDEACFNRISEKIKDYLNDPDAKTITVRGELYNQNSTAYVKDIVAISQPIPGHRRPTYHIIRGIKHGGNIDIVEIARGELNIQQMIPETGYYLHKSGKYCRVTHLIFSDIKDIITHAEVDPITLNTWIDNRALHPTLIKAAQEAMNDNKMALSDIQIFNTVKFGSLFIEQLIKTKYFTLATSLARYINNNGDTLNEICGSLADILPGANPEGTSLLQILNTSKPCVEMILAKLDDVSLVDHPIADNYRYRTEAYPIVELLKKQYTAVKHFAPNGVLTKENAKMIQMYLALYQWNKQWTQYYITGGGYVDLINYPEELKSVSKMFSKICNPEFTSERENNLRHYREIVGVYFELKEHGWNPKDHQIFIEFSLTGTCEEISQILQSREHAANTTRTIYKAKLTEAARKVTEEKYASRLSGLQKLVSTKELEQNPLFNGYKVLLPTQIYDETVPGSLEKEGEDMHHCVFRSYANSVADGTYTVLYLRNKYNPEESLVTIGITEDGRINQTYTFHDAMINPNQAQAIAEWAKTKEGYVSFKSEGSNVKPGGWNPAVTIPNLPKATQKL